MDKDYSAYFELEDRHWWYIGRRKIFMRLLEAHAPADRPLDVLDFGCGTGGFLEYLDHFGAVSAVEVDPDAVRFCHERGRDEVHEVSAGDPLPFPDDSFDLVTALDVIEHIEDDVGTLRELGRVMRVRGLALIAVPAFEFLWGVQDEISHHHRRYTAKTLRVALTNTGFTIEHLSYFNTFLFPPIALLRMTRRLLGARPSGSDCEVGPQWSHRLLAPLFSAEARFVADRSLPFGVSLLALVQRN